LGASDEVSRRSATCLPTTNPATAAATAQATTPKTSDRRARKVPRESRTRSPRPFSRRRLARHWNRRFTSFPSLSGPAVYSSLPPRRADRCEASHRVACVDLGGGSGRPRRTGREATGRLCDRLRRHRRGARVDRGQKMRVKVEGIRGARGLRRQGAPGKILTVERDTDRARVSEPALWMSALREARGGCLLWVWVLAASLAVCCWGGAR